MLDEVVTTLTWEHDVAFVEDVFTRSVAILAAAFHAELARAHLQWPERAAETRDNMRICPGDALVRVVTAPETFALLAARPASDEFLCHAAQSVRAELMRCGLARTPFGGGWTALGDYRSPSAGGAAFSAPTVAGIPIDFASPFSVGRDIPADGERVDYAPAEQEEVLGQLTSALDEVGEAADEALAVVHLFTRVVVVRKTVAATARFASASSPRYVGRTVLVNPQRASCDQLAEALVHEAIHGLLSGVALQQHFVLDHARMAQSRAVSPWTGNSIPLDALVDACFVWFGVWNLWRRVHARGGGRLEVTRLMERAASGFRRGPLVALLEHARTAMSDDVLIAVRRLQDAVVSDVPDDVAGAERR